MGTGLALKSSSGNKLRWLLIEEILSIEKGRRILSSGRVPVRDASPELFMVEFLAQTAAMLLGAESDFQRDCVFAKIESVDFDGRFEAGETVRAEVEADAIKPEGAWFEGTVRSASGAKATGRLMLASVERLLSGHGRPITFNEIFLKQYRVREKIAQVRIKR